MHACVVYLVVCVCLSGFVCLRYIIIENCVTVCAAHQYFVVVCVCSSVLCLCILRMHIFMLLLCIYVSMFIFV